MKIYSASFKKLISSIIPFSILLSTSALFDFPFKVGLLFFLLIFFITYIFINFRIEKICISDNKIFIKKWFTNRETSYLISEIDTELDEKMVGRSVKQNILKVYQNGTLILTIKPSFSGWDELDVNEIFKELQKRGKTDNNNLTKGSL